MKEEVGSISDVFKAIYSKIIMSVSAPAAAFELNEQLPDYIAEPLIFILGEIYEIEAVEYLSALALFLLVIERACAIVNWVSSAMNFMSLRKINREKLRALKNDINK